MSFSDGFCQKSLVLAKKDAGVNKKKHTMAISLQPIRYQNNKCNIQVWH